tara:strand:- start:1326 stop:1442 length:117 start_codon:yes stop_codon:yes gene_type:complete
MAKKEVKKEVKEEVKVEVKVDTKEPVYKMIGGRMRKVE